MFSVGVCLALYLLATLLKSYEWTAMNFYEEVQVAKITSD